MGYMQLISEPNQRCWRSFRGVQINLLELLETVVVKKLWHNTLKCSIQLVINICGVPSLVCSQLYSDACQLMMYSQRHPHQPQRHEETHGWWSVFCIFPIHPTFPLCEVKIWILWFTSFSPAVKGSRVHTCLCLTPERPRRSTNIICLCLGFFFNEKDLKTAGYKMSSALCTVECFFSKTTTTIKP